MGRVAPRALAEEQTGSRGGNPREGAAAVRTWRRCSGLRRPAWSCVFGTLRPTGKMCLTSGSEGRGQG